MKTLVAGGVVQSPDGTIVVVSQNGNSWSLPKGHIEPGESPEQAARREIAEEAGLHNLELVVPLGSYARYRIGLDPTREDVTEQKSITMFFFRSPRIPLKPTDKHNPEARWVSVAKALELITHPKDKEFLASVAHQLNA